VLACWLFGSPLPRIGATLLQTIPEPVFQLGQQLSSAFAASVLEGLAYPPLRATATGQTLEFVAERMLTPLAGRRGDAAPLVVVMLGAESQESPGAVDQAGQLLRATGARVIVVGPGASVSSRLEDEMLAIANTPTDIFDLDTIEALVAQGETALQQQFLSGLVCEQTASSSVFPSASIGLTASLPPMPSSSLFFSPSLPAPQSTTQLFTPTPTPSPSATLLQTSLAQSPSIVSVSSSVLQQASSSLFFSPTLSSSLSLAFPSSSALDFVSSSVVATPLPTPPPPLPTPTPIPLPNYCETFVPIDVVFVLSASGRTGQATFDRFRNLAAAMMHMLPMDGARAR
jgi:hypothetical protein